MQGNKKDISRQSTVGADDPFYPREGKTLTWSNVNMKLNGKDGGRDLLQNVWGEVPVKQITAIMGPSGAGKTSLLNILAGRARSKGNLTISADVRLNNYSVDPTDIEVRKQIAFVAQDDSLQETSTPREAIRFSAKLRLSKTMTEYELDSLTTKMLSSLGLEHCADTYCGGALLKGISGGERKRTSVGVELVTKPALVFLDEPTSGLDSFSATQVTDLLHKVANAGSTVLFTIHQPSSEVFNSFDHLILLNKGRVMYQGSVQKVPTVFENCKHPIPPNYNPADWIMAVAQQNPVEALESDGFFQSDTRKLGAALVGGDGNHDKLGFSIRNESAKQDDEFAQHGFFVQTMTLFGRERLNLFRDIPSLAARFGISIFLNLLFGIIFYDVGRSDNENFTNVQSHFGSLVMVLLSSMFGTAQPALFAIPVDRPVFLREYSTNHYSVVSYFMSKFTVEAILVFAQCLVSFTIVYWLIGFQANFFLLLAIMYVLAMASTALAVLLGSAIEDPKVAQEMLPLLFVPQMLFAGFFVAVHLIPKWLQWVTYVCSLSYGIKLGLLAEFDSCEFDTCETILTNADAVSDETWWYWLVLVVLFLVLRVFALYILKNKATSFY
jgi:ABC-type multidrug transport system ATPase subunit/ABC-type multidrug transport system permease subunit